MKRFILTGAPGAGKTAIIRQLEQDGAGIVEEAATDIHGLEQARGITEPWRYPAFVDKIVNLQKQRQVRASILSDVIQFHDRSVICTYALTHFLGYPPSEVLLQELARIDSEAVFQKSVFFVRNLGFITPTEARRISFDDALRFEKMHEDIYQECGYDIIYIVPGPLLERVDAIKRAISNC